MQNEIEIPEKAERDQLILAVMPKSSYLTEHGLVNKADKAPKNASKGTMSVKDIMARFNVDEAQAKELLANMR